MNRRKLSIRMTLLVVFIFLINFVAMKLHWYSALWWFDMPMHYLGGLWLGLAMIYFFPPKLGSVKAIMWTIVGVMFFALAWEVFEYFVDENIARNGFDIYDTLSDICFDLAGAFTALFYFFKRIIIPEQNTVQLNNHHG